MSETLENQMLWWQGRFRAADAARLAGHVRLARKDVDLDRLGGDTRVQPNGLPVIALAQTGGRGNGGSDR